MIALRVTRVLLHLLSGLLTCALVFPFADTAGRTRRVKAWSVRLLRICRIEVELIDRGGAPPAAGMMVVANHVSWIDIFVVNSMHPCRFVAKADIRDWPLVGWLCEKAGTIFLQRGKQREVRRIYAGLVHTIEAGEPVAFFPEGTTAPQGQVLPFHANLFEAAIEANVPVQPYALRYLDAEGRFCAAADFIGDMTFVESMLVILKAGGMRAQLILLAPMPTAGAHRRELAREAHDAIAAAVGGDQAAVVFIATNTGNDRLTSRI